MGSPFTARLVEALARDLDGGRADRRPRRGLAGPPARRRRLASASRARSTRRRSRAATPRSPRSIPPRGRHGTRRPSGARRAPSSRASVTGSRDFLRFPPQTNETRRAIALLAGFLHLAARFDAPIDLLEIGASAGLNLYWDRFAYRTASWRWGEPSAAADRHRVARPAAAARRPPARALTRGVRPEPARPAPPRRAPAPALLHLGGPARAPRALRRGDGARARERRLASSAPTPRPGSRSGSRARAPDALTVVYHSVFLQYPPRETRERIAAAIERAGESSAAPLAWLRLEPEVVLGGPRESIRFLLDVITWPGRERRTLAVTDGHVRFVDAS